MTGGSYSSLWKFDKRCSRYRRGAFLEISGAPFRGRPVLNAIRGITPFLYPIAFCGLIVGCKTTINIMANNTLSNAKAAKKDEFYTMFYDIETEMEAFLDYNPDVFRGKTVLLPCDDPEWSNFTKYFAQNFEELGLKKLISTSYAINSKIIKAGIQTSFLETTSPKFDKTKTNINGKIFVLEKDTTGDGKINLDDLEWDYLEGDGDFRSKEVKKLREALRWVSHGNIKNYMQEHRRDTNINELKLYFNDVISWIERTFDNVYPKMKGLNWGELYEKYHNNPYDHVEVSKKVKELYNDPCVKDNKNVFEYVLGGCKDTKLLNVRVFDENTKTRVYIRQTDEAKEKHVSNCPLCAIGHDANKEKIWTQKEMDADHVLAWSKGGATDESNCQMLCKTHNRAKGNR